MAPPVRAAVQLALGRARRIIAVSKAVAESAARIAPADRVTVVYNGVDPAPYEEAGARRDAARESLDVGEDEPLVLCVARLAAEKGVGTFLEAAALTEHARYVVAGEGPQRARIQWQLRLLGLPEGRVTLLGGRDDVPDLLAAADLVCAPSREEGLGLSVIEAMAAGRPVVASRVGGLPEVVEDGVSGVLVAPRDPKPLTDAVTALLADPARAREMGEAGRERVRRLFSRDAMLAGTRAVYAQALAGK